MNTLLPLAKKRLLYRDQTTQGFWNEIDRLESCLLEKEAAERRLPFGCFLKATRSPENASTTTLRIFLDPLRFRAWRDNLGPVEMLYMNPCGIEVVKRPSGRWGIYLDGKELLLYASSEKIYEVAQWEIRPGFPNGREAIRIK